MKPHPKTGLFLGKQAATPSLKTLKLEDYLDLDVLPAVPASFGNAAKMPLPRLMLGNGPDDTVKKGFKGAGCCVASMMCNFTRLATALAGKPAPFTGKEAIALYSAMTGYVIGKDSTDNGTNMLTALNYWRQTGVKDANGKVHKIEAFASINLKAPNLQRVLQALYVFSVGVPIGVNFPASAMTQFQANQPWTYVKGSPSDGGHCVLLDQEPLLAETWARDQAVDPKFVTKQCDEAYAVFTKEMLTGGKTPLGLNATQLLADLKAVTA